MKEEITENQYTVPVHINEISRVACGHTTIVGNWL
jgi:hypothetical protein